MPMNWRGVLSVSAAVAIQLCNGGLYAWSTYVPALEDQYGLSMTQCGLIFSTTMAFFTSAMVLGGPVQERRGPRPLVFLSGLLFAAGHLIAARSDGSLAALLLGLGCLGGTAIGLGYVSVLGVGARWFPHHCGLVTGIVVAGFGASGMVVARVASTQLSLGADVLNLLGHTGAVYASVVILSGLVLSVPGGVVKAHLRRGLVRPSCVLREPAIRSLVIGMFCGTFGGLLIISNLKPLVMSLGASASAAAWAVGAFAMGNALGRILWGRIADRIGHAAVPASLACLTAALVLFLHPIPTNGLVWACIALGACFGAAFVVYAAETVRICGREGLGLVYPWVFVSYGLAGIAGPALGGWLTDALGNFEVATLLATVVSAAGTLATCAPSRSRANSLRVLHSLEDRN